MNRSTLFRRSPLTLFLLVVVVGLVLAPLPGSAFGAGNIPSYSYLEDKAFRHGDIEDILSQLSKVYAGPGGGHGMASIMGVVGAMVGAGGALGKGKKFSPLDIKRVYFGNFLRDYSQAVDVGSLQKVPLQTVLNVVMVLGFMAFGYATGEFEVTKDRLGCYLPTEHIDNPKGYADGKDARQFDPRLRGPVHPRELEIDPQTGMKNYIANEGGNWDTSKGLVRRVLESCIHFGRQARANGRDEDLHEAYRLLGQALHTLEDFTAHSNWCEIALWKLGHKQVFTHVGNSCRVRSPHNEMVPPIVTGTFGGSDFVHSLLGEATDHLSEASVSDLQKSIDVAKRDTAAGSNDMLRSLLFQMPGASSDSTLSREMDDVANLRDGQQNGTIDPMNMSPQQLHANLWKVLEFRDSVAKKISNTIDKIPGLGPLVEKLTNSLNVFVLTTLEPFMKPLVSAATTGLSAGSAEVVNNVDQFLVWNDANASDPTHSFLSKDHFKLILNEPAGQVAQVIVEHTVKLVVQAWDSPDLNTRQVTEPILEALFHPYFQNPSSEIQRAMLERFSRWFNSESQQQAILQRLTADAVRNHKNVRLGETSADGGHMQSVFGNQGLQGALAQHNIHVPGAAVLNAGQDLMSGKKPWQAGFGSGGPNAWREMGSGAESTPGSSAAGGSSDQNWQKLSADDYKPQQQQQSDHHHQHQQYQQQTYGQQAYSQQPAYPTNQPYGSQPPQGSWDYSGQPQGGPGHQSEGSWGYPGGQPQGGYSNQGQGGWGYPGGQPQGGYANQGQGGWGQAPPPPPPGGNGWQGPPPPGQYDPNYRQW